MSTWFEELAKNIEHFFEHASDDEINLALKKADYDVYKNIDTPILAFHEPSELLPFYDASLYVQAKDSLTPSSTRVLDTWSKVSITISQCNNKTAIRDMIFPSELAA